MGAGRERGEGEGAQISPSSALNKALLRKRIWAPSPCPPLPSPPEPHDLFQAPSPSLPPSPMICFRLRLFGSPRHRHPGVQREAPHRLLHVAPQPGHGPGLVGPEAAEHVVRGALHPGAVVHVGQEKVLLPDVVCLFYCVYYFLIVFI